MLGLALTLALVTNPQASKVPGLEACLGTSRYATDLSRVREERTKLSDQEWVDACRQAREANERRRSVGKALIATGRSPIGGFQDITRDLERARIARDPVVAELHRRLAADQFTRSSLSFVQGSETFARGLSPTALMLLDALTSADAVKIDADNRAWLKSVIKQRGWFRVSRDGADADAAAWLIVQHADMDRDFQRTTLELLKPLAVTGESSRRNYALLFDRWAAGTKNLQRYGLQGRCTGPSVWTPDPIAEPERVDQRRREADLPGTLAEQRERLSKSCS